MRRGTAREVGLRRVRTILRLSTPQGRKLPQSCGPTHAGPEKVKEGRQQLLFSTVIPCLCERVCSSAVC